MKKKIVFFCGQRKVKLWLKDNKRLQAKRFLLDHKLVEKKSSHTAYKQFKKENSNKEKKDDGICLPSVTIATKFNLVSALSFTRKKSNDIFILNLLQ